MGGGNVKSCSNELQKKIQDEIGWGLPLCADNIKESSSGNIEFVFGHNNTVLISSTGKVSLSASSGKVDGGVEGPASWHELSRISRDKVDAMRKIIREHSRPRRSFFERATERLIGDAKRGLNVAETIVKLPFTILDSGAGAAIDSALSVFSGKNGNPIRTTAGDVLKHEFSPPMPRPKNGSGVAEKRDRPMQSPLRTGSVAPKAPEKVRSAVDTGDFNKDVSARLDELTYKVSEQYAQLLKKNPKMSGRVELVGGVQDGKVFFLHNVGGDIETAIGFDNLFRDAKFPPSDDGSKWSFRVFIDLDPKAKSARTHYFVSDSVPTFID